MSFYKFATGAAAIIAGFGTAPAYADLTAQDLWDNWKSSAEGTGQTVSVANESYSGGVLTLDGISFGFAMPEGDMGMTLETVTLTESGDGSVSVEMPDSFPIIISGTDPDGGAFNMTMRVNQPDASFLATGSPEAINYGFSVPLSEITFDEFTVPDEELQMDLKMTLTDSVGTYATKEGTLRQIDSDFTAGSLSMDLTMSEPGESLTFDMDLEMQGLSSTSTGSLSPFAGSGPNLGDLLRAGMQSEGTLSVGPTTYAINLTDPNGPFHMTGKSDASLAEFSINENGILYGGTNEGVSAFVEIASVPIPPIELLVSRVGGQIQMPFVASDVAQDFAMKLDLVELVLSDDIWNLFDPSGALPRDPADLTLDLSGKGRWNVDITDPVAIEELEASGGLPGEVENIDINSIALSLMGATLNGTGGFGFNNNAPIPAPSGAVDFELTGVEGLLDTLVAAGLLPEDQATGARLMLGLFAQRGEAPDTLKSTIELTEDGSVLANGQRIR